MNINRITALCLRQWYLIRDNPTRLIQIFGWVFFDILLWGFLSQYLSHLVGGDQTFTPLFLGGVLVWYFSTRVMHGIATAFFEDVWAQNFFNLFASPLGLGEYAVALVATGMATSVIGLLFMIVIAKVFFGFSILAYGIYVIPLLLILFLNGVALGIFAAALVLRFGPAAEWFVWPIPEMLSPLVGVFYPIAVLPFWMQGLSRALPPTYVFESIRTIVTGGEVSTSSLLLASALGVIYCALSYLYFARVYRLAVKNGLIARYSSESF